MQCDSCTDKKNCAECNSLASKKCDNCDNKGCCCRGCNGLLGKKCPGYVMDKKFNNELDYCSGCEKRNICSCAYCYGYMDDSDCVGYKERKN